MDVMQMHEQHCAQHEDGKHLILSTWNFVWSYPSIRRALTTNTHNGIDVKEFARLNFYPLLDAAHTLFKNNKRMQSMSLFWKETCHRTMYMNENTNDLTHVLDLIDDVNKELDDLIEQTYLLDDNIKDMTTKATPEYVPIIDYYSPFKSGLGIFMKPESTSLEVINAAWSNNGL